MTRKQQPKKSQTVTHNFFVNGNFMYTFYTLHVNADRNGTSEENITSLTGPRKCVLCRLEFHRNVIMSRQTQSQNRRKGRKNEQKKRKKDTFSESVKR